MKADRVNVYVRLIDEPVEVWRPVPAEPIEDSRVFRLLPDDHYDATQEQWEFEPGSVVYCETRPLSGGEALVAIRRATSPGNLAI